MGVPLRQGARFRHFPLIFNHICKKFPREDAPVHVVNVKKTHFLQKSTQKDTFFSQKVCKKVHFLTERTRKSPLLPEKHPPPKARPCYGPANRKGLSR